MAFNFYSRQEIKFWTEMAQGLIINKVVTPENAYGISDVYIRELRKRFNPYSIGIKSQGDKDQTVWLTDKDGELLCFNSFYLAQKHMKDNFPDYQYKTLPFYPSNGTTPIYFIASLADEDSSS